MAAAPINPSDLGFAKGSYGTQKVPYLIPGCEGSGTVVVAGSGLLPRLLVGSNMLDINRRYVGTISRCAST